jgi:N4-gp56 family major capsid protein
LKVDKTWLNILNYLMPEKVHADGEVATAQSTENDGVILPYAVRAVYSREIEFKAMPLLTFRQFATMRTELGVEPGDTINMLTYDNLKLGGQLIENVPMTTQALSQSMKQLKVTEWGNAIAESQRLITTSFEDVMGDATTLLARDYSSVIDVMLRDTALSGTNVVYASKSDGTAVTSRSGLDGTSYLKVSTIDDAIEVLQTYNAPRYNGTSWICIAHPHQIRRLREDPRWLNANTYGGPETPLFINEIGSISDVRFIVTTAMKNGKAPSTDLAYAPELANGFAGDVDNPVANTDVYQAVIFGDRYLGMATALPVELRDNGIIDFGRTRALAWYAILGAGILHDNYGIVLETA